MARTANTPVKTSRKKDQENKTSRRSQRTHQSSSKSQKKKGGPGGGAEEPLGSIEDRPNTDVQVQDDDDVAMLKGAPYSLLQNDPDTEMASE